MLLLAVPSRDWFDWSGWIATIVGTVIAISQLIPVLNSLGSKDEAQLSTDHVAPTALSAASRTNRRAPPLVFRAIGALLIAQPLVFFLALFGGNDLWPTQQPSGTSNDGSWVIGLAVGLLIPAWFIAFIYIWRWLRAQQKGWLIVYIAGICATLSAVLVVMFAMAIGVHYMPQQHHFQPPSTDNPVVLIFRTYIFLNLVMAFAFWFQIAFFGYFALFVKAIRDLLPF